MIHILKQIIIITIIFYTSILSQSNSDTSIVFYNSCPFECCQFGKWIIKDSINVYQNEGDTSSVSFTLVFDDTVFATTGNLHFLQVGKVVVLKRIYKFQPNDTLIAFNCGEEDYLVSFKGEKSYVRIFWPIFPYEDEDTEENYIRKINRREYFGKMIQRPKSTWWVKINSEKGDGWIKLENKVPYCFSIDEKIMGMDGCS